MKHILHDKLYMFGFATLVFSTAGQVRTYVHSSEAWIVLISVFAIHGIKDVYV